MAKKLINATSFVSKCVLSLMLASCCPGVSSCSKDSTGTEEGGGSSSDKKTTVRITPDRTTVLRNPLNGWTVYLGRTWNGNSWTATQDAAGPKSNYDAMPTPDGTVKVQDWASTAYLRAPWAKMEPTEGAYFWKDPNSDYYKLLKSVTDRGLRLSFRIVVDGRDQGQNTPLYVVNTPGAKYFTHTDGGKECKTSYPDCPIFQEKYEKFLTAFAEEFNNSDLVDFIDGYGFGKWGECHSMLYSDGNANTLKIPVFEWVTSLYARLFTEVPLLMNYHRVLAVGNDAGFGAVNKDTEGMLKSCIDKGYSLRHDAFGMSDYYQTWEKEYAKAWNFKRPIVMEGGWITGGQHRYWVFEPGCREGHPEDVRQIEYDRSAEAHVNMMDLRTVNEIKTFFNPCFDLVKKFVAEGGYRLYPDQVSVPEALVNGTKTFANHRWINLGFGYCPNNIPQWNYRYKVALALLDSSDKVKAVFVDTDSDPSKWINGTPTSYKFEFTPSGVPAGEYTWAIGLVDTKKSGNPIGLQMAVKSTLLTSTGWAKVASVKVK